MLTRSIPSTGEAMPVIGLGTWRAFDVGTGEPTRRPLREVLRLFLDAGGRIFDGDGSGCAIEPVGSTGEVYIGSLTGNIFRRHPG